MSIYVAGRDLASVPLGTHQFIVIEFDSFCMAPPKLFSGETIQPKPLGNGHRGIVIGAHNTGRLSVKFFEASDWRATQEHFNPQLRKWYKPDFSPEFRKVHFMNGEFSAIRKIFDLVSFYKLNEEDQNIPYPTAGFGTNSNSWAQSVIHYAEGKICCGGGDLKGLDIYHGVKIPKQYFEPLCQQRPGVNQ